MKNWNHFYKYKIKPRFDKQHNKMKGETTMEKLKHALGEHLG